MTDIEGPQNFFWHPRVGDITLSCPAYSAHLLLQNRVGKEAALEFFLLSLVKRF